MTHLECIARIVKDIEWYTVHQDERHTAQAYEALASEAKAAAKELKTKKLSAK